MWQRKQTLYLLIAMGCLLWASWDYHFFEFITEYSRLYIHGRGAEFYTLDNQEQMQQLNYPWGIVPTLIAFFALWILFDYKKVKRQFKLAKILWFTYLILLISTICIFHFLIPYIIGTKIIHSNYATSFYLLVIGFPFVHLACMGINKDKKLIDSLNRLR